MGKSKGILDRFLKYYRSISIDKKFLAVAYIQIFIPIILIGVVSFRISSDLIFEKYIGYTSDVIKTARLRIVDKINELNLITQDVLYQSELYNILEKAQRKIDYYDDVASFTNKLRKIILGHRDIQSIGIFTKDKKLCIVDNTSQKKGLDEIVPLAITFERLYHIASNGDGKPVWYVANIDGENENNPVVLIVRLINNPRTLKFQGILAIMVNTELFTKTFSELVAEKSQAISLIGQNTFVCTKGQLNKQEVMKLTDSIKNENGVVTYTSKESIVNILPIKEVNWYIVTSIPVKVLFRDIDKLRIWLIILCFLSFMITSATALLLSMDFLKPISAIVEATKKVRSGEYTTINDLERKDELGLLIENFNSMVQKINHLINSIYKEQITRKEAEIKALQSQLNPHFLFNILESINWLAQLNGVSQISDVVIALSRLLEVNLKEEKFLPLEEELKYITSYISILKINFGEENLKLEIDADKKALKFRIPKLLIQPLVENSVFHGIRPKGRGKIFIGCYVFDEKLNIIVKDDGIGMNPEKLNKIRDGLADELEFDQEEKSYTRIGLLNVVKRLKLIYGSNAHFSIESVPNKGTTIKIEILVEAIEKVYEDNLEYL
ncbi:sensor histidine kinase [Caldicellulosiruptor naganoensis]|uniref:Histidine kinase n=1 Tax=Caldicellulosiruptor naganoensis TaxID=29324 RepID=A0ABY7BHY2_9FIRM|nr:histidine kinase [Caldicellulosiruptor naganoensis]WAM31957.1 histidine kinase [Caldicellulosiruptor naganoensis]